MNVEVPMGRPPKDPAKKRSERFVVMLTPVERAELNALVDAGVYEGDADIGRTALRSLVERHKSNKQSNNSSDE